VRIAASSMLVLLGCGAGATAPAVAPAAAPAPAARVRDLAVPEPYRPPPQKPPEPGDPRRPWLVERQPRQTPLGDRLEPLGIDLLQRRLSAQARWEQGLNATFAESELWEPCVRDFVRARSEPVRRALTAALAYYRTACAPDGSLVLQGVRGLDGRERSGRSDVGFTGALSASGIEVSLRVAYCEGALAAERIAIAADGERWSSPPLVFAQDEHGCEVAELTWTRPLARAVWSAVTAADAAIAFDGGGAHVLAVTDEMKQHLRTMLEVLDAFAAAAADRR
jgi:hypothetical protein